MSNNEKAPVLSREEKAIAKANAKMEKKLATLQTHTSYCPITFVLFVMRLNPKTLILF